MKQFVVSMEEWSSIVKDSFTQPQFIFKHSTRCSISSMALNRVEASSELLQTNGKLFIVDVVNNRNISNQIEESLNVQHESPQFLLIVNGKCVFDQSHYSIKPSMAIEFLQSA